MKLTQDERDLLLELTETETWAAVLKLCKLSGERQLEILVGTPAAHTDLVIRKAKLEGAQDVYQSFRDIKSYLKPKKEKQNG